MFLKITFFILIIASSVSFAERAYAAPQQLLEKTIFLDGVFTMIYKKGDGPTSSSKWNSRRIIYVSSAGRVFSRITRSNDTASFTDDRSPEAKTSAEPQFTIQGDMIVTRDTKNGFRNNITVTFDPTFTSCNVDQKIDVVGPSKDRDGSKLQAESISAEMKCSVKAGNAFAN